MVSISPVGLAVSPDGRRAYVMGGHSGLVSVIDTTRNTVIDSVIVGGHPWGVAVSPDSRRAYITDCEAGRLWVMETDRNVVIDTVHLPVHPQGSVIPQPKALGVATSQDGRRAYILADCHSGMMNSRSWVFTMETYDNRFSSRITLGGPRGRVALWSVAVSPNGRRAYIVDQGHQVFIMDTVKNAILSAIQVDSPVGVAVSPDGRHAYSGLSVIDIDRNSVTKIAAAETKGWGVVVSPDGKRAYTTGGDSVSVINTADNNVMTTIPVGGSPRGVAISPDGRCVYTANSGNGSASVITDVGSDQVSVNAIELP